MVAQQTPFQQNVVEIFPRLGFESLVLSNLKCSQ